MTVDNTLRKKKSPEFKEFFTKAEVVHHELCSYVTSSLSAAENLGLIDRQYYDPDGILDEVYMSVFEKYTDKLTDSDLKYLLFRTSLEKIEQLIRDEEYTPNDPSTTGILKQELDALEKKFIVDADGDWIFQEELDDISYKQDRRRSENIYLDESLVQLLVQKFELEDKFIGAENKRHLGALYNAIPSISKSIVELYAYGDQEVGEIKNILEVERASVERVLKIVKEKFRLI